MRQLLLIGMYAVGMLFNTSGAIADELTYAPNPLIGAYGGKLNISSVSVVYPDDALEGALDTATSNYVANKLTAERKQAFETFASTRANTPTASAERFSEFLATQNLRSRLITADYTGPRLDLVIEVQKAHIPSAAGLAFTVANRFPYTDMTFALTYAATKTPFASGRIRRCSSINQNIEDAKRRHDLQFNWSGTDTQFRIMAGATSALSDCVVSLVSADSFPIGRSQIGTAYATSPMLISIPITMSAPTYEIELATAPPTTPH